MTKRTKQNLIVAVVSVTLFVVLMNLSTVLKFCGSVIGIISPVIAGGILALFISVPMNGIEKRLKKHFEKAKRKPSDKRVSTLSFVITVFCVLLVFVLVLTLLVPEIVRSCKSLYAQIEENIPRWQAYLNDENNGYIESFLSGINWEQIMESISEGMNSVLPKLAGALSSTVNVVITACFALIISIYITLGKKGICRHAQKLACAYLKPGHYEKAVRFCKLFKMTFSKFLTGQCSEAIILGTLMAIAFTVFRIPYASLIGVLTAICAIIPYVGAFISCSVSVFLVLLIDPLLAIRCLIVYLAVQFIENQFIYPRVVGSSVGLPPFYTLVSAMIGGKLFGIIGIIFFIPLAAVMIEIIREDANQRINQREKTVYAENERL